MRLVPDDGPRTARIVIIGEAPGATEEQLGRPFVGAAGYKLNDWMRQAGLDRRDAYVTNVVPYRPTANNIETVPKRELADWTDKLHERLAALADPWVIVPTGNTALRALTGKVGITKHRGSIYAYTDRRGRTIKVIPSLHPAAIFRQPAWERRGLCDWQRIAGDATFRGLCLPSREHVIRPSLSDVESYVADITYAETLALDIETPGGRVACIAFSHDPAFSITIPTTLDYWQTETTLADVWGLIRRLCDAPCAKILQNGLFDTYYLAEDHDIALRNWQWDTMAMHHLLDATDTHSLAYMASVDTREPYWKDDSTDPEEMSRYASDRDAMWTYCGKDAAVTRELCNVYRERLADESRLPFYDRHYRQLFLPLLRLMRRGLRVDEGARRRRHTRLSADVISLQDALSVLAGEPLYGKVALSPKRLAKFLYGTLGLPKQINRKTGGVTTAEVTIRRLLLKYGTNPRVREAGELVLDIRRKQKLMEFYQPAQTDADGRLRCSIRFTTETGRLAARESPKGTGRNLFNVDREVRDTYLPEPGMIFVEADLSQAEDRVVGMLTGHPDLIALARTPPWEVDVHRIKAAKIFGIDPSAVTKAQRYIGKVAKHSSNYGVRGKTFADGLLKEGYVYTEDECQRMIDATLHPAIPEWHRRVRAQVLAHKCLVNSWGRMLTFEYVRLDDDAYRRAYAFVPQSEIPMLLNQYGFLPLDAWLTETGRRSVINLQVYDSLLISCPPEEVWDVMAFVRTSLERPRRYAGRELTIPVGFTLGRTWRGDVEFTRTPTRDEVEAAVARLC